MALLLKTSDGLLFHTSDNEQVILAGGDILTRVIIKSARFSVNPTNINTQTVLSVETYDEEYVYEPS